MCVSPFGFTTEIKLYECKCLLPCFMLILRVGLKILSCSRNNTYIREHSQSNTFGFS